MSSMLFQAIRCYKKEGNYESLVTTAVAVLTQQDDNLLLLESFRLAQLVNSPACEISRHFFLRAALNGVSNMAGGRLVLEAEISIKSFMLGLGVLVIPSTRTAFPHVDLVRDYLTGTPGKVVISLYVAVINGLLLSVYRGPLYKVAVRACFLGVTFGCGLLISLSQSTWTHFGWYMCSLSFFHYSEYLVTAVINPRSLSLDSFLLNHSVDLLGLAMVLCGECLRKAAMLTAGSNFNHIVQNEKAQSHVLVTGGVYALFRHPSWRFFRERIEEEELSLIHFFGEDYVEYKKRVSTGLPFISGIRVN
ncbi:hypothetical protein CRUP_020873 [Coryphaenoides rupestris]|nr:hypothetical protein CRUP_020873 [Coryphaenoides rupestris]